MKANLDGLMVKFNSLDASLPIIAIQAIEPANSVSTRIFLKPEYRYDNKSHIIIRASFDDTIKAINQVIVNANKKIFEEA